LFIDAEVSTILRKSAVELRVARSRSHTIWLALPAVASVDPLTKFSPLVTVARALSSTAAVGATAIRL